MKIIKNSNTKVDDEGDNSEINLDSFMQINFVNLSPGNNYKEII